jgi:Protein of unknown function (DUF2510)
VPVSEQRAAGGWYPDPTGRFEFRYHNGVGWTADVSTGGRRFVDQLGQFGQPTGWPITPGASGQTPGKGMAVAAFVIGLVSLSIAWLPFLFVLAAVGAVLSVIFGVLGLRNAARHDGYGRGYAIAGIVLAVAAALLCIAGFLFTRAVLREVGDFLDPGEYEVELTRCDTEERSTDSQPNVVFVVPRLVTVEGNITNLGEQATSYTITLDYLVNGVRTESDTVTVSTVQAGETTAFEATAFVETATPVACVVAEVFGPTPFDVPNN